ncbi:collagen-binding protein [Marivirga tractuosa]|uniref:TonB-dependent receptor plug n=1 Tax=Marivirga tractuosa (strain ATCC 23168 / DSM 4126 / NBRC 15989 / NCIMB 1408 / VKM B-1430 / H-43) TaxID=643867 RepID=E4TSM4_MARTH|nr:TonB-dependent receptor [Marivirga tractuosa]ADR21834.1 TonB-dependent receptor plug [Marivirga tractuosa DSM 4126]BDD13708.1 collagen-binding protein [Marivirga tractuosa]
MKFRIIIILFFFASSLHAQKYTISGYVKDAGSGEVLIGATVVDKNEPGVGQATNVYGFYSFELPKGEYTLKASYVGFANKEIKVNLKENISLNFNLEEQASSLEEVVVSAKRSDENVSSVKMSTEKLQIERIKSMPALFGEVDVVKSLQLLPGVSTAGEGTSGMFVRGGSSDQNLILLDEATVYNASHLLGFFSVFNPDAVKNVEIYKGGIPAKYGGRVSSILDIQMREGNNQKFAVSGGLGTISSRLTAEVPIVKDQSSLLLSGRRTYADVFLAFAQDENIRNNTLYFYDFNTKFNYRFSDKDKIFVSGYFGRDNLGFQDLFGFDWGNATFSTRWNHLFNDKLFLNTTLLYSNFDYGFDVNSAGSGFNWNSGLQEYNLKLDFDYFLNNNNTLFFGANAIYHVFAPAEIASKDSNIQDFNLQNDFAVETALYVSNQQEVNDKLSLEYGVRYSSFAKVGPDSVSIYQEGQRKMPENEIRTDVYQSGDVVKYYGGFEPRIGVRYLVNSKTSLKASYNRMRQYLQVATNATAGFPTDRWIPADYHIKPVIGDQVALGYFRNINENKWEVSVEGYYKWLQNVVDFLPGEDVLLNDRIETAVADGIAWSYGAEFMLRKNIGKTTGWLSYTLSRTQRQIEGVASGEPYLARYDKPHDIALVLSHKFSEQISFSGNWVYASGAAVTFPEGRYIMNGQNIPYYDDSKRNTSRMPDFHRMDLGLTYKFRDVNRYSHEITVSFYNVYNRKNPFSIEFRQVNNNDATFNESEDGPVTSTRPAAVKTSLFGIIPSITYNFSFN